MTHSSSFPFINHAKADERIAYRASVDRAQAAMSDVSDRTNKMLKAFTRAVIAQGDDGDHSIEGRLLHVLVQKISSVRMAFGQGWYDLSYKFAQESAELYGGETGIESQNRDVFDRIGLPEYPSVVIS